MSAQALGWDLHRKFSYVSLQQFNDDGELRVVERARLEHDDLEAVRQWLGRLPPGTPVALEGAFGWPWVADLLEGLGLEPHLGHPPAIKVLAKNEAKGDRCDADRLGRFWLKGIFPQSYLAPPEVRQLRERTRYRAALVLLRTSMKNRIQAQLHRLGILHSFSDLFGKAGRAYLAQLSLPPASRDVLQGSLQLLDTFDTLIGQVEQWMEQNLQDDAVVKRLTTIPGLGRILAHVIKAEIGELPERFPSHKHLASYAGLAPLSDDSADRHGQRHISFACNHTLRWALVEAANVVAHRSKQAPRLVQLYDRLSRGGRVNKSQAKVAVARELIKLVYIVWKKGEAYNKTPPPRPGAQPRVQSRRQKSSSVRSDQPRHPMVRPAR
jgi:transposase